MGGHFDIAKNKQEIKELETKLNDQEIWNDVNKAQEINKNLSALKKIVDNYQEIYDNLNYYVEMLEIVNADELSEIANNVLELESEISELEINTLLNKEYDKYNCYLEIHPGAGGTESCDWASMLSRMYQRYAQIMNFTCEVLDEQKGDEAGIKGVTLHIKGLYAFGYLKCEKGVHRLVRISPFDSNARRHTSFASVEIVPQFEDDMDIEIDEKDLDVITMRSSGAGGQHINKTDSAVRMTHKPTGITVFCQTQRSQLQNREACLNQLKSKLLQLKIREQEERMASIKGEVKANEWGSQIRSYVFAPYTMVKDLRTGYEVGNIQSVMDGDLDGFVDSYLRSQITSDSDE